MEDEPEEYVRFSVREGIESRSVIQWKAMDDDLRIALWNVLQIHIWNYTPNWIKGRNADGVNGTEVLIPGIWMHVFNQPLDALYDNSSSAISQIREVYFTSAWNEILDLIESISQNCNLLPLGDKFIESCNDRLRKHNSAYRIVSRLVVPIVSESEIDSIETAIHTTEAVRILKVISVHIRSSLNHLSRRESPDYRNSIKESISAVEVLCSIIAGKDKAELGAALSTLVTRHQFPIHPQFRTALNNLYNYTSDTEGIRHGLMAEPTLDVEDARFMLVSCSAFVNYLLVKADKAGISLIRESTP